MYIANRARDWAKSSLVPYDADKHTLSQREEDKPGFNECCCDTLTAEDVEGKNVLLMPNCRHVHSEDCAERKFI